VLLFDPRRHLALLTKLMRPIIGCRRNSLRFGIATQRINPRRRYGAREARQDL
jgi:hypothetical protein